VIARVILLLLISALCAGAYNQWSGRGIPWAEDWDRYVELRAQEKGIRVADLEDTKRISDSGSHLIFDARPRSDYDAGHIPGAMSFPYQEVDEMFAQFAPILTPGQPILVYCSGQECDESMLLAEYLQEQGFTNVTLFAGGYEVWASDHGDGE